MFQSTTSNKQSENSIMSIYIPHVFASISKEEIMETFESQGLGTIKTIDFVSKIGKNGENYNAAYLHFKEWFNNSAAKNLQEKLKNPEKEARVIYDDPWFWLVLENKSKKHFSGEKQPRLVLGDLTQALKPTLSINIDTMKANQDFAQMYPPVIAMKSYATVAKEKQQVPKQAQVPVPFDFLKNIEEIKKQYQEEEDHCLEFDQVLIDEIEEESNQDWINQQCMIEEQEQYEEQEQEEIEFQMREMYPELFCEPELQVVDESYVYSCEQENRRLQYELSNLLALHQNYVRNSR